MESFVCTREVTSPSFQPPAIDKAGFATGILMGEGH
jgi:hypothetical protein